MMAIDCLMKCPFPSARMGTEPGGLPGADALGGIPDCEIGVILIRGRMFFSAR
jgi:hypothetical protein